MAQGGKKSDSPAKMTVSFVTGPHDDDEGHMVSYKGVLGDKCFSQKNKFRRPNQEIPSSTLQESNQIVKNQRLKL